MTGFIFTGGGAASGSTSITSTGSTTARTLADRFADRRNVLDFGADPTNTNDNSDAFYNAIAIGGEVYVPPGTYKFTKGINLDALGGNLSFSIVGAGSSTILSASMDDFIFRKVTRNTGSVSGARSIKNMFVNNTKLTAGTPVANINGFISWGTIVGGVLAGQTGLTVSAPSHGFTVGTSRLMDLTGVVCTGLSPNGRVGVYFNTANQFQFHFDAGDPGTYTSGGSYAPLGGAISLIACYGGALYNVDFGGYYGFYGEQDCTVDLFDCAGLGNGQLGTGIVTSGQSGIYGCDLTGFNIGIHVAGLACSIHGGRLETNNTGIYIPGQSYVHIAGLTLESNYGAGIHFYGAGSCVVSGVQVHCTTSNSGLYFYGANNHILIENVSIFGTASSAGIYFDPANIADSVDINFKGVTLSITGGGGVNTSIPVNTVCPQWVGCQNVATASFKSTYANRPGSTYLLAGDTWIFSDSAVAAGSSTAISGGGANVVIGRYDGTNWYAVCRAG